MIPLSVILLGLVTACEEPPAENYFEKAAQYYKDGDRNAAVVELKNALQQDPKNAAARSLLGRIYLEVGNPAGAEKELGRARDLGQDQGEWLEPYGQALLLQAKYDQVLEEFEIDSAGAGEPVVMQLVFRSEAQRALGQLAKAEESLDSALEMDAKNLRALVARGRLAMQQEDLDTADQYLSQAVAASPEDTEVLMLKGELKFRQREFPDSEAAYQALHDTYPQNSAFLVPLAAAKIATQKFDQAKGHLETYLAEVPNQPQANFLRAMIAYQDQDFERVKTHAETALIVAPTHPGSRLLAGASSYALAQYEQALNHLQLFLADFPGYEPARRMVGATLLRLERADEAVAAWKPLADQTTEDVELLAAIGAAAMRSGDMEASRTYFEKAAAVQPDNARTQAQLGAVNVGIGDLDQGIEALERALELDPGDDRTLYALVIAQLRAKEYDGAIASAKLLQESKPDSDIGYTLAGIAQAGKGDTEAARAALEQALQIKPAARAASAILAALEMREGNLDRARSVAMEAQKQNPGDLNTLLLLAQLEERQGDRAASQAWMEQAVEANPEAPAPRVILARMHLRNRQPDKALAITEAFMEDNQDNTDLIEIVGRSQVAVNRPGDAADTFQLLVRKKPGEAEPQYLVAAAALRAGDLPRARDALERTLRLDEDHERAKMDLIRVLAQQGVADRALRLLDEIKAANPETPEILELDGTVAALQQRYPEAVDAFLRAAEKQPSSGLTLKLAQAQRLNGDEAGGRKTLDDWLSSHPDDVRVQLALARQELSEGRLDAAEAQLGSLQQKLPGSRDVLLLGGDLAMARGQPAEAAALYQKAHAAQPARDVTMRLAQAQWDADERQASLNTLEDWMHRSPGDLSAQFLLANRYLEMDRLKDARAALTAVVNEAPDNFAALNNLAWVTMKLGSARTAWGYAERALAAAPDNPRVMDTAGVVLTEAGQVDRAVDLLRQAALDAPEDVEAEVRFHLAQALAKRGNRDEAREILRQVLADKADFKERGDAEALLDELERQ